MFSIKHIAHIYSMGFPLYISNITCHVTIYTCTGFLLILKEYKQANYRVQNMANLAMHN
jgi:hypothetical protein